MGRQLIYVIFALCAAMTLTLLLILVAEPVAGAGGVAHLVFEGMRIGGDGSARLESIGSLAYGFQALLLVLIVALATLGRGACFGEQSLLPPEQMRRPKRRTAVVVSQPPLGLHACAHSTVHMKHAHAHAHAHAHST